MEQFKLNGVSLEVKTGFRSGCRAETAGLMVHTLRLTTDSKDLFDCRPKSYSIEFTIGGRI